MSALLALFVASLLPSVAQALEMEYHLVGTGNLVIPALQRLALVFSDYGLETTFISVTAISVLYGTAGTVIAGFSGARISPVAWLVPVLLGGVLFGGAIAPKGTLHVYDDTTNRYQPVGGIPDLVVFLAGSLNLIERAVIEAVDTGTADAESYRLNGNGLSFGLLREAHRYALNTDDIRLDGSVHQYWEDCLGTALNSPAYPITNQVVYRTTRDPVNDIMAELTSPSIYTISYLDTADKAGDTVTCTDAWTRLSGRLLDPDTFEGQTRALCGRAGFNPNDAGQLVACKEVLGYAYTQVIGNGYVGDWATLIRSLYVMQRLQRVMTAGDQDLALKLISNQQILAQAIGQSQTAGDWMNQMRGLVIALSFGAVPFLLLFIATPIAKKALMVVFGLLFFTTAWGVMDAVAHRGAMDAAYFAMMEIQRSNLGMDSIWLFPHDTIKAAVVFGEARTRAVMMAGFITTAIIGVGAHAMTQMASNIQATIDQAGNKAGRDVSTQEGRNSLESSIETGVGAESKLAGAAAMNFGAATAFENRVRQQATVSTLAEGAKQGWNLGEMAQVAGANAASSTTGAFAAAGFMSQSLGWRNPSEVAQGLTAFAGIERAMQMGNRAGAIQALHELTPTGGNVADTLLSVAHAQALESAGKGASFASLVSDTANNMQRLSGQPVDRGQVAQTLGRMGYAQLDANTQSVAGNVEAYTDFLTKHAIADQAQFRGLLGGLAAQGVSLERASEAAGVMQAYTQGGNVEALGQYSPQEIKAGVQYAAFSNPALGRILNDKQFDPTTAADTDAGAKLSQALAFDQAARRYGEGRRGVDVATDSAGVRGVSAMFARNNFKLLNEEMPGLFTQDQQDAAQAAYAQAGPGAVGVLTMRFGEDGVSGADLQIGGQVVAQSSSRTDASSTVNRDQVESAREVLDTSTTTNASTTFDNSTSRTHGHRIEGAEGVATYSLGTVNAALEAANQGDYQEWGDIALMASRNEATRTDLLNTLADKVVGAYGRIGASDSDSSIASTDIGAKAGVAAEGHIRTPPGTPVGGSVTGSGSVEGGVTHRWQNSEGDSSEWNLTRAHLEDRWDDAHQRALTEVTAMSGADVDTLEREYQDRLSQYTAQAVLATRDQLREEASEQAKDAESGLFGGKRLPD